MLDFINNILWGYILIIVLIGCAVYFTFRSRFVQFRLFKEMIRLLGDSGAKDEDKGDDGGHHHISSFQAFTISLASRVGTGNLAGVASAIAIGGPGAVFWMWLIALLGASSAFVESTLAQLYKTRHDKAYVGGPAYYMRKGLNSRWMSITFAILITLTFGFAFNSVQSNTICEALSKAFGWNPLYAGTALTAVTLIIIFGGVHRIAKVSSIIVPVMALGYILLALIIVAMRISELPHVIRLIISHAFGWEQFFGGGVGMAVMQGIKRGLFSNEAGMGSAPNAAATASVSHPVKQGLIQALGVFTDTLLICTCTAFIILFSGAPLDGTLDGVQLTQQALTNEVGNIGEIFVAIAIFFFAFSSILGNYYYGEANIHFITKRRIYIFFYRLSVAAFVMFGALTTLRIAWSLADLMMALMTLCNLLAIIRLAPVAFTLLKDYVLQKKKQSDPVFHKSSLPPEIRKNIELWE